MPMNTVVFLEPVQRGGAGVADSSSGATAGPASAHRLVTRFTFAIKKLPAKGKARAKRAAAVAGHLDAVPGAVVIDEQADGDVLRLTVAVWPALRPAAVEAVAVGCPGYVAGTFEVRETGDK